MKYYADKGDTGLYFDADGFPILVPIDVDTETGEVSCIVVNSDGSYKIDGPIFVKETRWYKPPISRYPLPDNFDGRRYIRENYYRQAPERTPNENQS